MGADITKYTVVNFEMQMYKIEVMNWSPKSVIHSIVRVNLPKHFTGKLQGLNYKFFIIIKFVYHNYRDIQ